MANSSTTTTTPRPSSTTPPPPQRDPRSPPPPQQHQPHHYSLQSLPNIAPRPPQNTSTATIHPPQSQNILYPVASSGRGFLPKSIRTDQSVTVANPGGGFARNPFLNPGRVSGSDQNQMGQIRPTHLQHTLLGAIGAAMPGVVKATNQGSANPKVAPPPPTVSESNGYKDARDKSRDDNFAIVRERKVRITDGASLYALCRSWLRNGFPEETQPQYMDGVRSLPRPLPIPVGDANSPLKKEDDKEEEEPGLAQDLSPEELLQRHIKRAKRVRSRLREERLKRIARYKTRLALLLPPIVEQQLRNDTTAGN